MAINGVSNGSQPVHEFMRLIDRKEIVEASGKRGTRQAVIKIFCAISKWFGTWKKAKQVPSKKNITMVVNQIPEIVKDNFNYVLNNGLLTKNCSLQHLMWRRKVL